MGGVPLKQAALSGKFGRAGRNMPESLAAPIAPPAASSNYLLYFEPQDSVCHLEFSLAVTRHIQTLKLVVKCIECSHR